MRGTVEKADQRVALELQVQAQGVCLFVPDGDLPHPGVADVGVPGRHNTSQHLCEVQQSDWLRWLIPGPDNCSLQEQSLWGHSCGRWSTRCSRKLPRSPTSTAVGSPRTTHSRIGRLCASRRGCPAHSDSLANATALPKDLPLQPCISLFRSDSSDLLAQQSGRVR